MGDQPSMEELAQARAELDRLRQPNNPDPRAEALLAAVLSKAALPDALALFQVERNGPSAISQLIREPGSTDSALTVMVVAPLSHTL